MGLLRTTRYTARKTFRNGVSKSMADEPLSDFGEKYGGLLVAIFIGAFLFLGVVALIIS